MSPRSSLRIVLAAALLVAAGASAVSAGEGGVRELVREWHARLALRRPDLASRLGARAAAERLLPVDDGTLAADAAWIAGFRARLARVSATGADAADRDALLAWCAAESAAVAPGGRWWRDPDAYVAMVDEAVAEPLDAKRPGPCDRAERAARRLARVPDVLRGAQVVLRRPERGAAERAASRLDSLLVRWRGELPARLAGCRESYAQAALIEADTLAIRAGARFLEWLRTDVIPHAEPGERPADATPLPRLRARP